MGTALVTGGRGFVGAWLAQGAARARRDGRLVRPPPARRAARRRSGCSGSRTSWSRSRATSPTPTAVCRGARRARGRHRLPPRRRDDRRHRRRRRPCGASSRTCAAPGPCSRPAASAGVERVVVASSDKAYGAHDELPYREDFALQPTAPYEASKAAADLIARSYWHSYGLPVAVTRFANIYGGGDLNFSRLIPEAVSAAIAGPGAGAALRRLARARLPLRRGRRRRLPGDRRRTSTATRSAARPSTPAAGGRTRSARWSRLIARLAGTGVEPEIRGRRQSRRARSTASTSTRRSSASASAGSPRSSSRRACAGRSSGTASTRRLARRGDRPGGAGQRPSSRVLGAASEPLLGRIEPAASAPDGGALSTEPTGAGGAGTGPANGIRPSYAYPIATATRRVDGESPRAEARREAAVQRSCPARVPRACAVWRGPAVSTCRRARRWRSTSSTQRQPGPSEG